MTLRPRKLADRTIGGEPDIDTVFPPEAETTKPLPVASDVAAPETNAGLNREIAAEPPAIPETDIGAVETLGFTRDISLDGLFSRTRRVVGLGDDVIVTSLAEIDFANGAIQFAAKVTQVHSADGLVSLIVFRPFKAPEPWGSIYPSGHKNAGLRTWRFHRQTYEPVEP